tara:strand:- start:475 stop:654 length:180 start_codon:yes stop_codon:yes gene_type:complete
MTDKQSRKQHRKILELCHVLANAVKLISLMDERLDNSSKSNILKAKVSILFDQIQNIKR